MAPSSWGRTLEVRDRFDGAGVALHAGLGIHPQALPELPAAEVNAGLDALPERLRAAGACAVGECGLDGPSAKLGVSMERQQEVLRAHLEIARDLGLPVILHCLKAHGALLALLEGFGPLAGVMHSYSGAAELVPRYLALGLHLSFGGPVTYPGARKPPGAAAAVPDDRLLIETDAPDQVPFPRGEERRNEPAFLPRVAAALEAQRGRPVPDNSALFGF